MALDTRQSGFLPMSLLALAVAAGGLIYWGKPYSPARPPKSTMSATTVGKEVEAELWQDPIEAVRRQVRAEADERGTSTGGRTAGFRPFRERLPGLDVGPEKEVQVLAVIVPGLDLVNDHEKRLRSRYALAAALTSKDFVPERTRSLGYFCALGSTLR